MEIYIHKSTKEFQVITVWKKKVLFRKLFLTFKEAQNFVTEFRAAVENLKVSDDTPNEFVDKIYLSEGSF